MNTDAVSQPMMLALPDSVAICVLSTWLQCSLKTNEGEEW